MRELVVIPILALGVCALWLAAIYAQPLLGVMLGLNVSIVVQEERDR